MASIRGSTVQWICPATQRRRTKTLPNARMARQFAADREKEREHIKAGFIDAGTIRKTGYKFEPLVGTPQTEKVAGKPGLIDEFNEELRNRGVTDKYRRETDRVLRRVVDACGMETVGCVTTEAVKRYLNRLRRNRLSARTRNGVQRTMHLFAEYLLERGRVSANPFGRMSTAKESKDKREKSRSLTFEETEELLAVAGSRRLYYLFRFRTGLRVGECSRLVWSELDHKQGLLRLLPEDTKNEEPDWLPLSADLLAELRGVLAMPNKPMFPTTPTLKTWRRDIERAGIDYDAKAGQADRKSARNTYITSLINAGIDSIMVSLLARHSLQGGAQLTYNRYAEDAAVLKRKQAAIRQLDRWIEKQRQKAKTAAA